MQRLYGLCNSFLLTRPQCSLFRNVRNKLDIIRARDFSIPCLRLFFCRKKRKITKAECYMFKSIWGQVGWKQKEQVLATTSHVPSSVSRTHMVGGENQFLREVFWHPPTLVSWHTPDHTSTHTNKLIKQIRCSTIKNPFNSVLSIKEKGKLTDRAWELDRIMAPFMDYQLAFNMVGVLPPLSPCHPGRSDSC